MSRLRHSDFIKIFEEDGFEIINNLTDHSKEVAEQLEKLKLNTIFHEKTKDDLAILGSWITLQKV